MRVVDPPTGPLFPPETHANGCFETMRAYQGKIFRLSDHLDRLYASAAFLGSKAPADRKAFSEKLTQALKRSGIQEAVVRVALIPQAKAEAKPNMVVQPAVMPTAENYRDGLQIAVVPAKKFSVGSITPQAKYSARLGSVMAVADAQLRGVDEALFLDETGSVTESTASNFGMIKRKMIITPPCSLGLLAGITRDVLAEIAEEAGAGFAEEPLTRHDIYNADEAFLTSTLKEVIGVTEIDGRTIGTGKPGPITRKLLKAFRLLVKRELKLK